MPDQVEQGQIPSGGSTRVAIIDRRNPEYLFYSDCWQMLDILFDGGVKLQRNVDKFIVRRPKELYDVFYERTRRLTYQDILQSCISWHLSKMFERDPVIQLKANKSTDLENFLENCDNSGTNFIAFSRDVLKTMMLFKSAYILVDKPRADGSMPIVTRQDMIDSGVNKPYLTMFDPRNVINWGKDKYGNFEWVVLKTIDVYQESATDGITVSINWWEFNKTTYKQYQFKLRKKEDVDINSLLLTGGSSQKLYGTTDDSIAELVDEGPHVLSDYGRVPIYQCQLPMDLWHAQRAYLHLLEHVDAMNGFSWKLFMCNLPQLVIFSDEEVTGQTLSETGFLRFGPNDKIEWLEPKSASFQVSAQHLTSTRQEVYRSFHLQAQAKESSATADGASGFSKEVDMMPAVDVLNALGNVLRQETQNVLCNVKLSVGLSIAGDDRPDISGYDFEVKPTLRDVEKYEAASDAGILVKSPTLEKTIATDIAMDMVSGKNAEIKDKIRSEIQASHTLKDVDDARIEQQGGLVSPGDLQPDQSKQFQERQSRKSALDLINAESSAAN